MPLQFLEQWYQRQCNGYWEHAYGVTIESLDQPGWIITIDLAETPLESLVVEPVREERSPKDWMTCEVSHRQFRGQGDARKLDAILAVFEKWATTPRPA